LSTIGFQLLISLNPERSAGVSLPFIVVYEITEPGGIDHSQLEPYTGFLNICSSAHPQTGGEKLTGRDTLDINSPSPIDTWSRDCLRLV
jgi:hypothetical protein